MNSISFFVRLIPIVLIFSASIFSQDLSSSEIKTMINKYKQDMRGPYKAIKWFCPDGSIIPADQRCPEPGGVQRAQHKDEVSRLAKTKGIFLGQILAATSHQEFLDINKNNSRLKQYQLEKYLRSVDNGWILKRAQFYRGAFQAEDEEAWGVKFLNWLVLNDEIIKSKFYFLREVVKDIPHAGDDNRTQSIRSVSKSISDSMTSFMDLRVKIHGQPEMGDIQKVQDFRTQNKSKIKPSINKLFDKLIADMEFVYKSEDLTVLNKYIKALPADFTIKNELSLFLEEYSTQNNLNVNISKKCENITSLIFKIRENILNLKSSKARLALLDISIRLEEILFRELPAWESKTLKENLVKNFSLAQVVTGCGYIEFWEWNKIKSQISVPTGKTISLEKYTEILDNSRKIVEWGSAMVNANYDDVIQLFAPFEPMAEGFIDDKIRSSLLLALGRLNGKFGDHFSRITNISNIVFDFKGLSSVRGLNPGYALGELVVITGASEDIKFDPNKIYALYRPPADLKPVAGIITVTEGNLVSHVQLLARNLAIPNSVMSGDILQNVSKFAGKKVFYAVSPNGRVIIKLAENMKGEEKKLFEQKKRSEEVVRVPTDNLKLDQKKVINLRDLSAKDSGRLSGPKAANLAQLKNLFPDKVVEGLVISFGIFKEHMEQTIPGQKITYWQFLNDTFVKVKSMDNKNEKSIDEFILGRLAELRTLIKTMPMKPEFVKDLENNFSSVLKNKIGEVPVFIRSDTNMEDLKDFTGAGLNLTVFNVVDREKIFQGIRDVWASPYTERSYKWRQRLLKNPESVYPSILIIPTVDVDKSGVMITTGLSTGDTKDFTVSFSRGAGGAVEGQITESYLLKNNGKNILLSTSRENVYNKLPLTGGTVNGNSTFEKAILSDDEISQLRAFAKDIKQKLSGTRGFESGSPLDIELGFLNSKLWLFQVRPFVENKKALSSAYLQSLDPEIPKSKVVNLDDVF
ncbi:MAG: phosphoenolpyruvate synthase [Ignavibacteriae bacterium HGW-Ignavibacteriae-2]|nr:MAG: phosphoenolpyruvate synthase [Ignavibacteriae bacterium HGW-Ignavibacteriae-2]